MVPYWRLGLNPASSISWAVIMPALVTVNPPAGGGAFRGLVGGTPARQRKDKDCPQSLSGFHFFTLGTADGSFNFRIRVVSVSWTPTVKWGGKPIRIPL